MNQEKNWIHEMGPEEERKINDKIVEQGISDMPRSEPLEMIKKLSAETTNFKRMHPELEKEISKLMLENEKINIEPKLTELENEWEEIYELKEKVDSDLEKYFGETKDNNGQLSFKDTKTQTDYEELKKEQEDLEYNLKNIEFKIRELTQHKKN